MSKTVRIDYGIRRSDGRVLLLSVCTLGDAVHAFKNRRWPEDDDELVQMETRTTEWEPVEL